ncbi:MAG: TolC family protein [Burkholderiales bacterium]
MTAYRRPLCRAATFVCALALTTLCAAARAQPLAAAPASAALPPATAASMPAAAPGYTLWQLTALTLEGNPALAAERARLAGARARVRSASAHPNPEVEWLQGQQRARLPGTAQGTSQSWSITQPLELPGLRRARIDAAQADVSGAQAGLGAFEHALLASVRHRYYTVLRLQAESRNAEQDVALAEQIHARVKVRVGTGESPRYELIRAEAERLNAQRAVQTARLREQQARAELRRMVGLALPADFSVQGSIEDAAPAPPPIAALRSRLLERHPELVAVRAELRGAESRLQLEQARRLPSVALRVAGDRAPDMTSQRIGVVLSVPLFDRREGPIGEAQAHVLRLRSSVADRELGLTQGLEIAWQHYQIARSQVAAYEGGIVRQAESARRVAEAAYRYGERGILDYLDAQRAWRLARNELNAARFELRAALVEMERLRAEAGVDAGAEADAEPDTYFFSPFDSAAGIDPPAPSFDRTPASPR